ncbi:MAG: RNA polymerase sigma factor [Sandaracinaceae bacterium]
MRAVFALEGIFCGRLGEPMADEKRIREADTAIGGERAAFPATPGSAIFGVRSDDAIARARAFSALVRAYWKPVYKRIRLKYGKSNEEAKDLTQAFFARALEREVFETYEPEVARFRTFVRRCLDNFVMNAEEARTAKKRGGGAMPLSLHFEEAELELVRHGHLEEAPDESGFDRDFVRALHDLSLEALREDLRERGREKALIAFERYDLADDEASRPTYGELADELGVKASDVTNYLHATRKRLRAIVLMNLRTITTDDAEYRSEALDLLGIDPTEASEP